jgi:pimeloyl-ACP methyl ester carboxylesterase
MSRPLDDPADRNYMIAGIRGLLYLSQGYVWAIEDMVSQWSGPLTAESVYRPPVGSNPGYAILQTDVSTYIFINGVQNIEQANGYINGFLTSGTTYHTAGGNGYALRTAQQIASDLGLAGATQRRRIDVIGHSFGGVVGALLLAMNNDVVTPQAMFLTTFGAPKPGTTEFCAGLPVGSINRIFTISDSVPLIPPYGPPTGRPTFGTLADMYRAFDSLGQTAGGIVCGNFGLLAPSDYPEAEAMAPTVNIALWLYNAARGNENPHSLSTYARYLGQMNAAYVQPVSAPAVTTTMVSGSVTLPAAPPPITSAQVTRVNRDAAQNLSPQAAAIAGQAIDVPDVRLARVQRIGRIYNVLLGQVVIASTVNRRQAHGVARKLNAHLRSLQSTAAVDTLSLTLAYQDYVAAASIPGGDFAPPINAVT